MEGRCLKVFIHAPYDYRAEVIAERMNLLDEKEIRYIIKKMDKERRSYYEYFTDERWLDMSAYDLCIDSSRFTEKQIVGMLKSAYEAMEADSGSL